ncbi:hypothetical protein LCGC14_2350280, partial [marine sediment metagenome]
MVRRGVELALERLFPAIAAEQAADTPEPEQLTRRSEGIPSRLRPSTPPPVEVPPVPFRSKAPRILFPGQIAEAPPPVIEPLAEPVAPLEVPSNILATTGRLLDTIFRPFTTFGASQITRSPENIKKIQEINKQILAGVSDEERSRLLTEKLDLEVTELMPEGEKRELFVQQPWWQQLLAELPAWIVASVPLSVIMPLRLWGLTGKLPKVAQIAARIPLAPAAAVEKALQEVIRLPFRGAKAVIKGIKPRLVKPPIVEIPKVEPPVEVLPASGQKVVKLLEETKALRAS